MKTRREKIVELLSEDKGLTLLEIADLTNVPVKVVVQDLDSVRKTIRYDNKRIEVRPAVCMNCNYTFSGRSRISDPHKCPECHSERISPQIFRIISS